MVFLAATRLPFPGGPGLPGAVPLRSVLVASQPDRRWDGGDQYWTKIGIAVYRVRFDTRLNEQSQRVNLSEAFDGLELVAREVRTDWLT